MRATVLLSGLGAIRGNGNAGSSLDFAEQLDVVRTNDGI
jgi:hypothetical protein